MNSFSKYLANQINQGKLDAEKVFKVYPEYANEIKELLVNWEDEIPTVNE